MQIPPVTEFRRANCREDVAVSDRSDGYVALLELPGGRLVVMEPREDTATALAAAFSLVPPGTPVVTRAVIPVIASAADLMAALAEAMHT